MKLYQDFFRNGWRHTIQRPGLWLFGFFATFVFGAAGEVDRYLRYLNASLSDSHVINPTTWANEQWVGLVSKLYIALASGNVTVWLLCLAVVVSVLIVLVMICISIGALIHSTVHGTESFADAFAAGKKHWLQLAALLVPTYILTNALVLSLAAAVIQLNQLAWIIVGGIVLVPFVIGVSLWLRYATLAIVIEDKHIGQALIRGWQLLSHHWLVSLEMAIINFMVATATNLGILLALVIMIIPLLMFANFNDLTMILFVGKYVYSALALFSAALLSTWQWSAWTLLFQTLQTEQPKSTLVRWAKSIA